MKAVLCTKYGPPDVLELHDVDNPVLKDDEVLIRVFATAVTASDLYIRGTRIPVKFMVPMRLMVGLTKPRKPVLGLVLAGEIAFAGKNITRFSKGDRVYGMTGFGFGAYAEYKCLRETDSTYGCLANMPSSMTYNEATAAVYGGLLALQQLEKGNIQPGHKVLIYGV